jgi:hypothetical protein
MNILLLMAFLRQEHITSKTKRLIPQTPAIWIQPRRRSISEFIMKIMLTLILIISKH